MREGMECTLLRMDSCHSVYANYTSMRGCEPGVEKSSDFDQIQYAETFKYKY